MAIHCQQRLGLHPAPGTGHAALRRGRFGLAALLALSLAGCLNTSTIIRVNAAGSGTIEQTLMFNPKAVENAFAGMGLKSTGSSKSQTKPLDEAALKEAAGKIGDGVTLVSVTPVKLPSGYEGVTARFAFADITKLQTEDFLMPGPAGEMSSGGSRDRVGFSLVRNPSGTSTLTARFDESGGKSSGSKNSSKNSKGGPGLDDPEVRQMVKTMFKGFRIAVDLEVVGQIVQTDADYVNGKRITLAEIDMEQLLLEGKKLESMDKVFGPDASIAKVRPYLKDIKGLKINRSSFSVELR